MSEKQLYPRPPKPKRDNSYRPWGVKYGLAYDDGYFEFTEYYRTRVGARIAAFWKYYISSWGGYAELFDNRGNHDDPTGLHNRERR